MASPPDFTTGQVLTASQMNAVGLWLTSTHTLTSASNTLDNIFSDDFDNYRITGFVRAAAQTNMGFFQLITNAGATQTASYQSKSAGWVTSDNSTTPTVDHSTSNARIGWIPNSSNNNGILSFSLDIIGSRSTTFGTSWHGTQNGVSSGVAFIGGTLFGLMNTLDGHRGIVVSNTAAVAMTGTIRVYGYRD
jgi:hypothetical protein